MGAGGQERRNSLGRKRRESKGSSGATLMDAAAAQLAVKGALAEPNRKPSTTTSNGSSAQPHKSNERDIAELNAPDFFGEVQPSFDPRCLWLKRPSPQVVLLNTNAKRTANVISVGEVLCLSLSRESLIKLLPHIILRAPHPREYIYTCKRAFVCVFCCRVPKCAPE